MVINKNVQRKKPNERIVRINIVSDSREVFDDKDEDIEEISFGKNGFNVSFELACSVSNDDDELTRREIRLNSSFQRIRLTDVRS